MVRLCATAANLFQRTFRAEGHTGKMGANVAVVVCWPAAGTLWLILS